MKEERPIERWTGFHETKCGALDREARQIDISDGRLCVLADLSEEGGTLRPEPGSLNRHNGLAEASGLMRILSASGAHMLPPT